MPSNYTFNASMSCSATSATGYTQSQNGQFSLNLTQINQIESGRLEIGTSNTVITAAPADTGIGKAVYVRNLDTTNFLEVHSVATVDTDVIGILEPGEWMFFILRDTQAVGASADTAAIDVEYFAFEVDAAA
tara:strand:- start:3645 stop:4040 length:396 start_codon:yes stop_codon:yes gene_type:complete